MTTNPFFSKPKCPKCNCFATPWHGRKWVCDVCGFGKVLGEVINHLSKTVNSSEEINNLSKTVKEERKEYYKKFLEKHLLELQAVAGEHLKKCPICIKKFTKYQSLQIIDSIMHEPQLFEKFGPDEIEEIRQRYSELRDKTEKINSSEEV